MFSSHGIDAIDKELLKPLLKWTHHTHMQKRLPRSILTQITLGAKRLNMFKVFSLLERF